MNKLIIIGNLTRDPVSNTTPSGINVCNFSVAVNRGRGEHETTDYFRVTVWRNIAESCAKYLRRGSRVCCWGAVTASTYQAQDARQHGAECGRRGILRLCSPRRCSGTG